MGLFGKIPVRGDFLAVALPRALQTRFEDWIKAGLSLASQSDSDWHGAYMSSPIWQFAVAPGFADTHAWCGVIMPSVDSVGRPFPLVIATQRDAANADVLMSAQNLAQAVLAEGFSDVDDWMAEVTSLARAGIDDGPDRLCAPKTGGVFRVVDPSGEVRAELRESGLDPALYSRLIGVAGPTETPEGSLL